MRCNWFPFSWTSADDTCDSPTELADGCDYGQYSLRFLSLYNDMLKDSVTLSSCPVDEDRINIILAQKKKKKFCADKLHLSHVCTCTCLWLINPRNLYNFPLQIFNQRGTIFTFLSLLHLSATGRTLRVFFTRSAVTTETPSLVSPWTPSPSRSRPSLTPRIRGVALPRRGPLGRGEATPREDRTSQGQLLGNSRYKPALPLYMYVVTVR